MILLIRKNFRTIVSIVGVQIFLGYIVSHANEVDNGGNIIAMEFNRIAREVHYVLKSVSVRGKILTESQLAKYKNALKVPVEVRKGPVYDIHNRKVDAKLAYDRDGKPLTYVLDQEVWEKYIAKHPLTHQFVFHEMLRFILLKSKYYQAENSYEISSKIRYGEAGAVLSRFNRNPQNTIYTKPDITLARLKSQECRLESKYGVLNKILLTYWVKKDKVIDIESVKVSFDSQFDSYDNFGEGPQLKTYRKPKSGKVWEDVISGFIPEDDYGKSKLDLRIGGTAEIHMTMQSDDDGVGILVNFVSDGPRLVGFHRCDGLEI